MLASQRIESVMDFSGEESTDDDVPSKRGAFPTIIECFILSWVGGEFCVIYFCGLLFFNPLGTVAQQQQHSNINQVGLPLRRWEVGVFARCAPHHSIRLTTMLTCKSWAHGASPSLCTLEEIKFDKFNYLLMKFLNLVNSTLVFLHISSGIVELLSDRWTMKSMWKWKPCEKRMSKHEKITFNLFLLLKSI